MDLSFLKAILVRTYFKSTVEAEIHLAGITAQKIISVLSLLDLRALWALCALFQGCLCKSRIQLYLFSLLELYVLLKSDNSV